MRIFVLLIIFIILVPFISLMFFAFADISKYAWGYRIRKIVFRNGEKKYYIQQRVPFALVWKNCYYMIGMDAYTERYYETKEEAKEFISKFYKSLEEERGYRVKSEETIK